MTNYWEDIRKSPPEPDHDKYWRTNREAYEKYFEEGQYQKMIEEKRFEEMQKIVEEIFDL
jgi:hypothetical protein